jgi:hypothetical protein
LSSFIIRSNALDVFDKRDFEEAIIRNLANDHRHLVNARQFRRPPTPLAGNELVALASFPDD